MSHNKLMLIYLVVVVPGLYYLYQENVISRELMIGLILFFLALLWIKILSWKPKKDQES